MTEDWSNFDTAVKEARIPRGPRCGVAILMDKLPDDGKRAVTEVLNDRSHSVSSIHRALKARLGDDAPSQFALKNHRAENCACGGES